MSDASGASKEALARISRCAAAAAFPRELGRGLLTG